MKSTLLDSDIFSEILKQKNENIVTKAIQYFQTFGTYCISTITVMEIVKGFHKVQREELLQYFLSTLSQVEVIALDFKSSEISGRIYADLERTGQPIGRADPMIAGIAIKHNLVLATGNTDHYQRIQKLGYPLEIENWKDD